MTFVDMNFDNIIHLQRNYMYSLCQFLSRYYLEIIYQYRYRNFEC